MKVVRSARLWFKEGTADKVYEVDLVENDALTTPERYLVNFRYGRRGKTLREGSKTAQPVSGAAAAKVYESVVVSKINEGYRRTDRPDDLDDEAGVEAGEPDGRARELLARLQANVRRPWPEPDRDRLLWRIGQVRVARAAPDLLALTRKLGAAEASYSLVWALARAGGAEAAPALEDIAAATKSAVVRDLARFALVSSLMGVERRPPGEQPDLPAMIARPANARDVDALCGALAALAEHDPVRVGPALVALGRLAQGDAALHGVLCAALVRLPARPPYLIGLRRLFKHAEMADDAGLFGATANRFETARPMYSPAYGGQAYVFELRRSVPLREVRGNPEARIGLSRATLLYLKRRIWRSLRKRAELGDPAFAELACAFLLSLRPADLAKRISWNAYRRGEDGRWDVQPLAYGPLSRNWTASQLLYRHGPQAQARYGNATFVEDGVIDESHRSEAFPDLWSARPDLALRLAAQSPVEPVAMLGLRVLRADPAALHALPAMALGQLIASPHIAVQRLALDLARERLASGAADPELLAILVGADLPEARTLALRRIEADLDLPWSSVPLAFALLTSPQPDVGAAFAALARERRLVPGIAAPLANRLVKWLRAMPAALDERAEAAIRALRERLPALWPGHDLPLTGEMVAALMAHPAPGVVAAGIALLARSSIDVGEIAPEVWRHLLGSDEVAVQEAALGLFGRLGDDALGTHAPLVLAFATAPASALRQAARPLVRRIAARDPALAERLARELIDTLFRAAPDEAYPGDIVALLREALPDRLAALDAGMLWRLLQARAKGAQLLGSAVLGQRPHGLFSVRQTARLGDHAHLAVRRWAMAAYEAEPARFQAEPADAVLLVESAWPETLDFAHRHFEAWPDTAWTPDALAVITDSVKPDVLAFARRLLRSRLRPEDSQAQLVRLLEHPSPSMHLLLTELLTEPALASADAFAKLIPLARIVMLQVLKGRLAKDRMMDFLRAEALRSRERAESLLPLLSDLTLSGTARDRSAAILALRDIAEAHPGLDTPLTRRPPEARTRPESRVAR